MLLCEVKSMQHQYMRNTSLHELFTIGKKSMTLIKSCGMQLRVKHNCVITSRLSFQHKRLQELTANARATNSLQDSHTANMTIRQQTTSTHSLSVLIGNGMKGHCIHLIPLKLDWNILLDNENIFTDCLRIDGLSFPISDCDMDIH